MRALSFRLDICDPAVSVLIRFSPMADEPCKAPCKIACSTASVLAPDGPIVDVLSSPYAWRKSYGRKNYHDAFIGSMEFMFHELEQNVTGAQRAKVNRLGCFFA